MLISKMVISQVLLPEWNRDVTAACRVTPLWAPPEPHPFLYLFPSTSSSCVHPSESPTLHSPTLCFPVVAKALEAPHEDSLTPHLTGFLQLSSKVAIFPVDDSVPPPVCIELLLSFSQETPLVFAFYFLL